MRVGILGGTGPAGRGLGTRLAAAGYEVVLGSRSEERAVEAAEAVRHRWEGRRLQVSGGANAAAAAADLVVVATPWEGAVDTVGSLAGELAGKVVVSMACALVREGREMHAIVPARGSVAAGLQAALPSSQVSAAFHHLPAADLQDLHVEMEADVLVCSDHPAAAEATCSLVAAVGGLRPLNAGSLAQAAAIEAFTAVCVTLNIRHRVHTSVRVLGI